MERCTLVDIDERVIETSKQWLPTIGCAFGDPRADVRCMDAMEYIRSTSDRFDVAIVDSTDPVDFAAGLFQAPFYEDLKGVMDPRGMMVELTESPFTDQDLLRQATSQMRSVFPVVRTYWGVVPTYPSGMWTYGAGSLSYDPRRRCAAWRARATTPTPSTGPRSSCRPSSRTSSASDAPGGALTQALPRRFPLRPGRVPCSETRGRSRGWPGRTSMRPPSAGPS